MTGEWTHDDAGGGLVAEARQLLDAATPVPWFVETMSEYGTFDSAYLMISRSELGPSLLDAVNFGKDLETAELVAAAPRLLAGLADEAEKLAADRDRFRRALRDTAQAQCLGGHPRGGPECMGGSCVTCRARTWLELNDTEPVPRVAELEACINRAEEGMEEALNRAVSLRERVAELEAGIREHRTGSVELLDRPTTSIDLALWALLDGDACSHGSVDTFGSGAGRRVDVCMACETAVRFWTEEDDR